MYSDAAGVMIEISIYRKRICTTHWPQHATACDLTCYAAILGIYHESILASSGMAVRAAIVIDT